MPRLSAYFEFLGQFRVGPEQLKAITCPTLALVGHGEGDEPLAQARESLEGDSGPKWEYRFAVAQGADAHCQFGNLNLSNQVLLDWLDEQFA